ncbi:hypothetical protein CQA49_05930 [Helicobacter sp. MIT 00-7814]|uniref:hypothetical protein n=1 Tax=unclassified Helicobacter TaxID=2593540 RepID=UPI000E1F587B|nr:MULTISPECIES: hypothetical protein [unclassified Helicobacter]RDU53938.1 hypothetical protein CQA49_05930 [Helicobacter sp. MIT 00-7814]RDU57068.1 hypothetical protein CQA37_01290 [Helicobacter sp. MIT 99-10781]
MGSFALGYLLGMTFSDTSIPANGYTMDRSDRDMTSEEWAKICADDDKSKGLITSKKEWKAAYEKYLKESKDSKEESYWAAWDNAVKQGVIEKLRNHETGYRFLASSCPNMSQDEQADLIESGELKILAPLDGYNKDGLGVMWTDENREEAKHPIYLQGLEIFKEHIKNKKYRVVS